MSTGGKRGRFEITRLGLTSENSGYDSSGSGSALVGSDQTARLPRTNFPSQTEALAETRHHPADQQNTDTSRDSLRHHSVTISSNKVLDMTDMIMMGDSVPRQSSDKVSESDKSESKNASDPGNVGVACSGANTKLKDSLPYAKKTIYGFNLPSSERLRTRNVQLSTGDTNLVEKQRRRLIYGRSMSGGHTLAVSTGLLFQGFNEKTTSHGIPHVYFAAGWLKRLIWSIVSLVAFIVLVLHCYLLIDTWRAAEVSTQISTIQQRKMPFPAVTVCNYNALRRSSVKQYGGSIDSLLQTFHDDVSLRPPRQRAKLRRQLLKSLTYEYAALNDDQFTEIAHNASELVLFCSFHGENCDEGDFYYFRDIRYGSCVTINSGRKPDGYNVSSEYPGGIRTSSVAGPEYGLSFVIFVEEYEYLPLMTEAVGAQIVIHNQTTMPFPDQRAISVTSNSLVNIGVRKKEIERLSGRYGNCTSQYEIENNIYHDKYKVDYSLNACLKTCFQREVLRQCGCYSPTVPYVPHSTVFQNYNQEKLCNETRPKVSQCLLNVQDSYEDGDLTCDYCHEPCSEVEFDTSYSSAVWPAPFYVADFEGSLSLEYPDILKRIDNRIKSEELSDPDNLGELKVQREEYIRRNFLQVNVYYEQMQVSVHKEISIYDDYQFASDLGGSFGLWMGWSIITMVEFVELIMDLFVFLGYSRCGK